jgi:hypothetical protein
MMTVCDANGNAKAGFYEQSDSSENGGLEFFWPNYSAEMDTEAIIGF